MTLLKNRVISSPSLPLSKQRIALWHRSPILTGVGLALLMMMVPTVLMLTMDDRLINGVNVWIKPLKFQLSVGTYLLTLAWLAGYSRREFLTSKQHVWFASVLAVAALFEVGYITFQAALGQMSHFNVDDAFHSTMYSLMGLGAVILTTLPLWLAANIQKNQMLTLNSALKFGIVSGLVLTSILGLVSGATISAFNGPVIGDVGENAASLWFLGWSLNAGDLRISHFIGLHILQLLPLVAWWLVYAGIRKSFFWTVGTSISLLGLWMVSYVQALSDIPFWSLSF